MQPSQRVATPMGGAVSSLVLTSSAVGSSAAHAMAENLFITSGAPVRNSFNGVERPAAMSDQFACIAYTKRR